MDNRDVMPEECESRRYWPLQPGHPVTRLQMQLCECTLQRERPKVASGEGGEVLGCNCRCSAAYSAAIADARLQLQMFNCNCRCSAAIADARGCNCRYSAAIADARLQLQNYSVAIADSKHTLQALRPGEDRSKNSSIAIADCKYTLQALRPGETAAPPSIADTPKERAAFQGGQNVLFTPLGCSECLKLQVVVLHSRGCKRHVWPRWILGQLGTN